MLRGGKGQGKVEATREGGINNVAVLGVLKKS